MINICGTLFESNIQQKKPKIVNHLKNVKNTKIVTIKYKKNSKYRLKFIYGLITIFLLLFLPFKLYNIESSESSGRSTIDSYFNTSNDEISVNENNDITRLGSRGNLSDNEIDEKILNKLDKSILWSFATGLRGAITTDLLITDLDLDDIDDSMIIGTSLGIVILNLVDGEPIKNINSKSTVTSIAVLNDVNNNGFREIAYSTIANREDNILVIDSFTGDKIWGYKPTTKVYTDNLGWEELGTKTWCVRQLDGIVEDSFENLVVSSWKYVLKLDGKNGNKIWEFTATDDIWWLTIVDDLTGDRSCDVIASSQDGYLYLINGQSGKKVWEEKLTKSYTKKMQMGPTAIDYKIDRSVWSSVIIQDIDSDSKNDIIVGAEDGFTYAVSGATGVIIWKVKCLKLSKPNDETGFGDGNYFNLQVQVIDDVDDDGFTDVLSFARSERGQNSITVLSTGPIDIDNNNINNLNNNKISDSRAVNNGDNDEFDSSTDDEELRKILEIENINNNGYGGVTRIAVGDDISGDGINEMITIIDKALVAFDMTIGNVSKIYMEHELFEIATNDIQLQWTEDITNDHQKELLIKFGSHGVILINVQNGEILWDIFNNGNFQISEFDDTTGDGVNELLLILSVNNKNDFGFESHNNNNNNDNLVRAFYLLNKLNGEVLWEYSVPINNVSTSGFSQYEIAPDLTSDGIKDIIGYSQNKEDLNSTLVRLLDGQSGKILWSKPPGTKKYKNPNLSIDEGLNDNSNLINHKIKSISMVNDLSGDGITDILLGGEESRIYLLNGNNGTQLWELTNNWEDYGQNGHEIWFESWVDFCDSNGPKQGKELGSEFTYQWQSDLDGLLSTESSFNSVLSTGVHTITLQVEDGFGNSGYDLIYLTAKPSDRPVFKIRDSNKFKYLASEQTNLWLESRNFDSAQATINWESNIDGFLGSSQNLQTYLTTGIHEITVTVLDHDNNLGETEQSFFVSVYEPRDLRVNIQLDNYNWYDIPANSEVKFNSELDYEGDWNELEYFWYVNGKMESNTNSLHRSFDAGIHEISLEVSNTITKKQDSITRFITVQKEQSQFIRFSITESYNDRSIDNNQDEYYTDSHHFTLNDMLRFQILGENFGEIDLNFTLDLGDGTIVYTDYFEYEYSSPGEYEVTAIVKDSNDILNTLDSTNIQINILPAGSPVSIWDFDNDGWCWVGDDVNLDCSNSFDMDGTISNFHWDVGDGTNYEKSIIDHRYLSSGVYSVTCKIQDNDGKETSLSKDLKVYSLGSFIADINVWINGDQYWPEDFEVPMKVQTMDSITIDTSLRNIQDEEDLIFNWLFDGAAMGSSKSITLPDLLIKGIHEIVLDVQDGIGNSDTLKFKIQVMGDSDFCVTINSPANGDVCVGTKMSYAHTQFIEWLPWTCNLKLIGDSELLIFGDGRLTVAQIDENGVSTEYIWQYPPPDQELWIDDNQVRIFDDQNGDEIMDILCWFGTHDGGFFEMLSGSNGEKLQFDISNFYNNMNQNENNFVYSDYYSKNDIFTEDFNRDNVNDAIMIKPDYDRNKIGITVLDGNSGTIIWEEDELFDDIDDLWSYQSNIPATIISDINGDDVNDILIGTTRTESEGADLRIFDGTSGKRLETITYEEQLVDEDWVKTVPVKKITEINDITGDNKRDIVLIRSAGTSKESFDREKSVLEIIDLSEGKIVRRFQTENADIINNGDITADKLADVLLIVDGTVYCLNGGFNVKILSPKLTKLNGEKFTLKWDKPDLECEVKVDGISYGYFRGGKTDLTLSGGKHVVQVLATDEFGGVVADSTTVEVPVSSLPWLVNILALTLLIFYIGVRTTVPYIRRKQRKRSIMEEIEKIKNLKAKRNKVKTKDSSLKLPIPTIAGPTYIPSITPKFGRRSESGNINKQTSKISEANESPVECKIDKQNLKKNGKLICQGINTVNKAPSGLEERYEMYRIALEIAYGDGVITEAEENLLTFLREKYGITMDEHRILETEFTCLDKD